MENTEKIEERLSFEETTTANSANEIKNKLVNSGYEAGVMINDLDITKIQERDTQDLYRVSATAEMNIPFEICSPGVGFPSGDAGITAPVVRTTGVRGVELQRTTLAIQFIRTEDRDYTREEVRERVDRFVGGDLSEESENKLKRIIQEAKGTGKIWNGKHWLEYYIEFKPSKKRVELYYSNDATDKVSQLKNSIKEKRVLVKENK